MTYKSIYQLKPWKDRCLNPLARWLKKCQITANQITVIGFLFGLIAMVLFMMKFYWLGAGSLLLSVFADLLDGTLARIYQKINGIGKYLDAVCDRLAEIGWVIALVFDNKMSWWAYFLPVGSILLLIARIIAYQNGIDTSFVLITRFERTAIIISSLIIPWLAVYNILLFLVIIGTFISGISIFIVLWQFKKSQVMHSKMFKSAPLSKPQIL